MGNCFRDSFKKEGGYKKIKTATCDCELKSKTCSCCKEFLGFMPEWLTYIHGTKCISCAMSCKTLCVFDPINKLCVSCGKKLVPIGLSRYNGKLHPDWDSCRQHKKCWLECKKYDEQADSIEGSTTEEDEESSTSD